MRRALLVALAMAGMTVSGATHATAAAPPSEALSPRVCPPAVSDIATCFGARDRNGSFLLVALPNTWNRALIVHAHGGPRMTTPTADEPIEDLNRFAVMVRAGYAWIGPSYRRGDYAVRSAAADLESARRTFIGQFGAPTRTILHGQSWGAQIALKTLEAYGRDADGRTSYDAALLTNGVVAGGVQAYQFRAELRAVFQFYCGNHPRPDEDQYPVWMGLPPGKAMSREEVNARIDACTGLNKPEANRTPQERQRLADILAATGVQERALRTHMNWATTTLASLINTIGGANPFDTQTTVYQGVSNPAALNAGVARFRADPRARAMLDFESKPTGQVIAPILSLYSRGDAQVSPALQQDLATTFAASQRSDLLTQIGMDWSDHSNLPGDVLVAALASIEDWMATGRRPDAAALKAHCAADAQPCAALR